MKNLSLILSILALAASGFLFVNDFSGDKGSATVDAQTAGKIAYVNIDSLQARYDFYKDIRAELEAQTKEAELSLQQRYQTYASKEDSYIKQAKAGLLSANKANEKKAELQKMAADVQEYEQSVRAGLASSQRDKNNELIEKITGFLKEYNKEKGYSYIFQHGAATTLLLVDEAQNITYDVVEGLNAAYAKEKAGGEMKEEEGK